MMSKDTEERIEEYYHKIIEKPKSIEVKNSYDRYCVYEALEKYSLNFGAVSHNKSYKKEQKYAKENTCKYCHRKKKIATNIEEWKHEDSEGDWCFYYHKCHTCNDKYANVWRKEDFMYEEKIPYKINIYYEKKQKIKCFNLKKNSTS